jgi:predicted PurR-regulated permease PerM
MLSRLVLLAVQLIVAWLAAPIIVRYLPNFGSLLQLFVYAVVFAVLVWIVGLVLSQVLREVGMPSSSTLVASIIVALIGAALITWLPGLVPEVGRVMRQVPTLVYPLIGAVLGYHSRR